ncbi:hypothetical protein [Propionivibrio sp.]|uniref:hypothetical protein n=1 Tax=Propionivibrio sp. TaxID=2212460 RepID=UPI003BF132D1
MRKKTEPSLRLRPWQHIRLNFSIENEAGLHLLESLLFADLQAVELDDSYEITATVVDSAMLDWWLRGIWGCGERDR